MTADERSKIAKWRMYQYQAMVQRQKEYRIKISTKHVDESGIRGSAVSDPTGKQGTMLADPPTKIKKEALWIEAINDAWAECHVIDNGDKRGLTFTMEKWFGIAGRKPEKSDRKRIREEIENECGISRRTLYRRIEQIVGIVEYHATRRMLL